MYWTVHYFFKMIQFKVLPPMLWKCNAINEPLKPSSMILDALNYCITGKLMRA